MATSPVPATQAVIVAQLSNAQQLADGLPSYRIYQDLQGSGNLAGPRAPGSAAYYREINTPEGFVAGSPQDPTPSPQIAGVGRSPFPVAANIPGMRTPPALTPPPMKLMWEPSTYVPGKGWINSSKPNG